MGVIKMSVLIISRYDLFIYLTTKQIASKTPPKSVYVKTKLRMEILTDEDQGRVIVGGRVKQFDFKSIGGGVYEASIKECK